MMHDVCADPLDSKWRAKVDQAVRVVLREVELIGPSASKFRIRRWRRSTPVSSRPISPREAEALELFKAGLKSHEVTRAMGVTKQRVSQLKARLEAKGLLP